MDIIINWNNIESTEDFYEILLPQVSVPEWHGRNLNAHGDSIVIGDVNGIEPAYTIINKNINSMSFIIKRLPGWSVSNLSRSYFS